MQKIRSAMEKSKETLKWVRIAISNAKRNLSQDKSQIFTSILV